MREKARSRIACGASPSKACAGRTAASVRASIAPVSPEGLVA